MNKRTRWFLLLYWPSVALFILLLLRGSDAQKHVVFGAGGDFFADFFNNVLYSSGLDPYFGGGRADAVLSERIYPPLCYLMVMPFALLFDGGSTTSLNDLWNNPFAIITGIAFIGTFALTFVCQLSTVLKDNDDRGLLITAIVFSGVFVFSLERGNLIWITVVGVMCPVL